MCDDNDGVKVTESIFPLVSPSPAKAQKLNDTTADKKPLTIRKDNSTTQAVSLRIHGVF